MLESKTPPCNSGGFYLKNNNDDKVFIVLKRTARLKTVEI